MLNNVKTLISLERLRIRHFTDNDLEDFVRFITDVESTKFLAFNEAQKKSEGAEALLKTTIDSYDSDHPLLAFAVESIETKEFVGFCGLTPGENNTIEIMYAVMPNLRGNGYAVEIARELSHYAIDQFGYDRVIAPISIEHEASKAVAKKAGFEDHGVQQAPGASEKVQLFVYQKKNS